MAFIPGIIPPAEMVRPRLWFVVDQGKLLVVRHQETYRFPEEDDLHAMGFIPERSIYLGTTERYLCFVSTGSSELRVPDEYEWVDLRSLFGKIEEGLFWIAGRANQLADWDRTHLFCGGCGKPTADKEDERAKICAACGLINYPQISPAVIVAVIKENRILLARNKRLRAAIYTVLAGFVAPGEGLEAALQREVREEVGITIKNIRYFGSQPWPFPNSLMIGFTAEYAGGKIGIDKDELMEAGWFPKNKLPPIPPQISIARSLIDWFIEHH
jgi:NAD+ diphosphatase